MSEVDLARAVQAELKEIRRMLEAQKSAKERAAQETEEPLMYPLPRAAKKLGVSLTKLRRLISEHVIYTKPLGGHPMVPRSELIRVSSLPSAQRMAPGIREVAASLSKVVPPSESNREVGIRVRNSMRPNKDAEQSKIDALLKRRPKKN